MSSYHIFINLIHLRDKTRRSEDSKQFETFETAVREFVTQLMDSDNLQNRIAADFLLQLNPPYGEDEQEIKFTLTPSSDQFLFQQAINAVVVAYERKNYHAITKSLSEEDSEEFCSVIARLEQENREDTKSWGNEQGLKKLIPYYHARIEQLKIDNPQDDSPEAKAYDYVIQAWGYRNEIFESIARDKVFPAAEAESTSHSSTARESSRREASVSPSKSSTTRRGHKKRSPQRKRRNGGAVRELGSSGNTHNCLSRNQVYRVVDNIGGDLGGYNAKSDQFKINTKFILNQNGTQTANEADLINTYNDRENYADDDPLPDFHHIAGDIETTVDNNQYRFMGTRITTKSVEIGDTQFIQLDGESREAAQRRAVYTAAKIILNNAIDLGWKDIAITPETDPAVEAAMRDMISNKRYYSEHLSLENFDQAQRQAKEDKKERVGRGLKERREPTRKHRRVHSFTHRTKRSESSENGDTPMPPTRPGGPTRGKG